MDNPFKNLAQTEDSTTILPNVAYVFISFLFCAKGGEDVWAGVVYIRGAL